MGINIFSQIEGRIKALGFDIQCEVFGFVVNVNEDYDNLPGLLSEIAVVLHEWYSSDDEVCLKYEHIPEEGIYRILIGDAQL